MPSGFVARQLTAAMVAEADLVLTATRTHRGKVATLHPKALRYVFTFLDFADLAEGSRWRAWASAAPRTAGAAGRGGAVRGGAARRQSAVGRRFSADIVDPFRRQDEVFVQMAAQVSRAVPAVAGVLSG